MDQVVSETVTATDSTSEKRKATQTQQNPKKRRKAEFGCKTQHDAANYFAETYFNRVRNLLKSDGFEKFIKVLSDYEEKPVLDRDETALYCEVSKIFESEGRVQLTEEFLGFIRPHLAKKLNKYTEKNFLSHAWSTFNGIDSHHFSKMLNVLEGLTMSSNVKASDIETALRPLFKGQANVVQAICQLFNSSKSLTKDVNEYETVFDINCDKDLEFEHVRVPRTQTERSCPGQATCQCACHASTAKLLCSACNVRFINGRIYVQNGKDFRSARLHFSHGVSTDEMQHKLHPTYYAQQQALLNTNSNKNSPNKGEKKDRKNSQSDTSCGNKSQSEVKCDTDKHEVKLNIKLDKLRCSTPPHGTSVSSNSTPPRMAAHSNTATPPRSSTPPRCPSSPQVFYEENSQGYLEFYREDVEELNEDDIEALSDSDIIENQPTPSDKLSSPNVRTPTKSTERHQSGQGKKCKPPSKRCKKI